MNTKLSINGIGAVARFGSGKDAIFQELMAPTESCQTQPVTMKSGDVELVVHRADLSPLNAYFKTRTLRRMNRFGKLLTLAAHEALLDSGIAESIDRSRLGLVVASGYGSVATSFEFLDSFHENNDSYVSPMTFSNSVHASGMSITSILLNITGPALTINQLENSVPLAFQTAYSWLAQGKVEHVLVGGVDEYCDILGYTYASLFGTSLNAKIDIHDFDKQSAIPGEGAGFVLLSRDDLPTCYGHVSSIALNAPETDTPTPDIRIIGFDGHPTCGRAYKRITDEVPTISLANLTGSLPVGPIFDVISGALMLHHSTLCHSDYFIKNASVTGKTLNTVDVVKADDESRVSTVQLSTLSNTPGKSA